MRPANSRSRSASGATRLLTVRTRAGPGSGWFQSSSGTDKKTGPAGGCSAIAYARMNASGTSCARAGS